jgi:hypothetical protein
MLQVTLELMDYHIPPKLYIELENFVILYKKGPYLDLETLACSSHLYKVYFNIVHRLCLMLPNIILLLGFISHLPIPAILHEILN